MKQKLLQVGSSAAVTIPKKALTELGIKIGDDVSVTIKDKQVIVEASSQNIVDPELVSWTKDFIERYKPALDELKNK